MDPQIGWFQPEQDGPAKYFWMRIWEEHTKNREFKSSTIENGFMNFENPEYKRAANGMSNRASTYGMNKSENGLIGVHGGCPWRMGKMYDKRPIFGLHQEIEEFYEYMTATKEEHEVRLIVIAQVKSIILSLWKTAQVEIFGSFKTSLYLPTSDIDIVVIGEWEQLPLTTLQDALLQQRVCDRNNIKVLDKASVPIVKFTHELSQLKIDISFNMNNGVKSVELIKDFCQRYPALRKLVFVLKQFLLQRDLNEVFHGGISSYSLILMCISFLQLHHLEDTYNSDCYLGILLIEFLELYGRKFNYIKTAISVKDGGMYKAKDKLQKEMIDGHRPSILSIEDPLTPGNDIGRGSYGALQVRHAFDYAYIVLTQAVAQDIDCNKNSILGRIIRVTDRVVDYRKWIRQRYSQIKHALQGSSSNSTDGSVSSLPSDSDSESNGRISDSVNLIQNKNHYPRRNPNNFRFNPQFPGYFRSNTLGHGPVHQQHTPLQKHHLGALSLPVLNTFGAAPHMMNGGGAGFQQQNELFLHRVHGAGRIPAGTFQTHFKRRHNQFFRHPKNNTEINLR